MKPRPDKAHPGRRRAPSISYGIVVHGGAGSSVRLTGVCAGICKKAFAMVEAGESGLDAVVEAVRLFEEDGRFNAGRGSTLRLDGRTVEMDAGVMDSSGRLGSVIAVRDVRSPILVARAVSGTPHCGLAGEGASIFARKMGIGPSPPVSERARKRHEKLVRLIREGRLEKKDGRWKAADLKSLWNFKVPYGQVFLPDTVGAVAKDRSGQFAVAGSTGGASPMMLGRVGDTAMVGSGFYAGPLAAIAATGIGEEIVRRTLAKTVYDLIREGKEAQAACEQGVAMLPAWVSVGVIAITSSACAIAANRRMASYSLFKELN